MIRASASSTHRESARPFVWLRNGCDRCSEDPAIPARGYPRSRQHKILLSRKRGRRQRARELPMLAGIWRRRNHGVTPLRPAFVPRLNSPSPSMMMTGGSKARNGPEVSSKSAVPDLCPRPPICPAGHRSRTVQALTGRLIRSRSAGDTPELVQSRSWARPVMQHHRDRAADSGQISG